MSAHTSSQFIRQRSAKLRRFVTFLLATLAVLLLLERFGAIGLQLFRGDFTAKSFRRLGLQGLTAVPETLYVLALWRIRQALNAFAQGELYSPTITRMLDRVGDMLAIGAVISVFLLPIISSALGFPLGYLIAYDVSSLVLGAIGLSLKIIADILRKASEAQAELDEIF